MMVIVDLYEETRSSLWSQAVGETGTMEKFFKYNAIRKQAGIPGRRITPVYRQISDVSITQSWELHRSFF